MSTPERALVAACLAGLAVLAAAAVACALYVGTRDAAGRVRPSAGLSKSRARAWQRWRVRAAAATAALSMWAYTGRPVDGLLAAAALQALTWVVRPDATTEVRAERLAGLAEWLHRLADAHTPGTALVQTLRAGAEAAPHAVAPSARALAERLRGGMDAPMAFALFADELADGAADHAVLFLQSHAVQGGPGLVDALHTLAATLHQQAADCRELAAEWVRVRRPARVVCATGCVLATGCLLNGFWSGCYASTTGQLALAALGGAFGAALWWARRFAGNGPDPRLLAPLPADLTAVEAR